MKNKKLILRKLLWVLGIILAVYFGLAGLMIALPLSEVAEEDALSKETALAEGMVVDQLFDKDKTSFQSRDGIELAAWHYPSESEDTLLFIHGASGHSAQLNKSIGLIQEATGIDIYTYDHRGHGQSPGGRGELDFVDQYVTDLADVLGAIRKMKPNGILILAGHSMGGGIIQRYALSPEVGVADAYILFAPALGMGVPGESIPQHIKPHIPRLLGIMMMNRMRISLFNNLPVVYLGLPEFDGHIRTYSYNAALSMRPQNFEVGMKALKKPTLVILGSEDEATGTDPKVVAELIEQKSGAKTILISGEGHHVQNHPKAVESVAQWIQEL